MSQNTCSPATASDVSNFLAAEGSKNGDLLCMMVPGVSGQQTVSRCVPYSAAFNEVQKNIRKRQKENLTNKDQVIKNVMIKHNIDSITDLVNEQKDETQLISKPDFDEKSNNIEEQANLKEERPARRRRTRQMAAVKE